MAILGWADTLIPDRPSKVLMYLNQANYPIYLYHMLVLTTVGFWILKINISPGKQFILINILSYGISFLIFEIYRRIRIKIFNFRKM